MTREDYMKGRVTHEQYYTHVAKLAHIGNFDSVFISRVRAALNDGDECLNTIPLSEWNWRAFSVRHFISDALKECGDFYSDALGVCVMKQAAENQAKAE